MRRAEGVSPRFSQEKAMAITLLSDAQDYIVLGGYKSPGLAEIVGARMDLEYQVKLSPGATGARTRFLSRKLSEFEVRIRCVTDQELADFEEFRAAVLVSPDKGALIGRSSDEKALPANRALDIHHPILADIGITSVILLSVGAFERVDPTGIWQVTLKFQQYLGMPKITQRDTKGSQATPADAAVDPDDVAYVAESLQNRDEIAGLVNRLAK
jgi:hypothetical protein